MTKDKWIVKKSKHYNRKAMFHISCNDKSVAGRIFNEANARLIASAPKLLEACKGAIYALEVVMTDPKNQWKPQLKALKSAIAQVETK